MKKFTMLVSSVALCAAMATAASAQVVAQGAPTSLPPQIQALVASSGGVGAIAAISIVVIGTILVVTITKNDGTTTTTTL